MADFGRQISPKRMDSLRTLASKEGDWWRDLLSLWAPSGHHGELRLAIRDGYLNFYSNGQSIARVTFSGDQPSLSVHHKYVGCQPSGNGLYLTVGSEQGIDASGQVCGWGGPAMLRSWIAASTSYRGLEKRFVEHSVADTSGVIDLEMGIPAGAHANTASRMDLVTLEPRDGHAAVVFWEAKMIGDSRLRSASSDPEVLKQVAAYSSFLAPPINRDAVLGAYRQTCVLLKAFHEMASREHPTPALSPLVIDVANDVRSLTLDRTPRIIVYDDGERRNAAAWLGHLDTLRKHVTVHIVPARPYQLPETSAAS